MKPIDIYNMPVIEEETGLWDLTNFYRDHFPEFEGNLGMLKQPEGEERVVAKTHKYFSFDGRRYWRLRSVWFDNQPIMVLQNAGREGDDHAARFITNEEKYWEMIQYFHSLQHEEEEVLTDVFDESEDIENLVTFYGKSLKDIELEEEVRPKKLALKKYLQENGVNTHIDIWYDLTTINKYGFEFRKKRYILLAEEEKDFVTELDDFRKIANYEGYQIYQPFS
ncbi:MAG: hypothetical protein ACOCQR_00865 [bacterium]